MSTVANFGFTTDLTVGFVRGRQFHLLQNKHAAPGYCLTPLSVSNSQYMVDSRAYCE